MTVAIWNSRFETGIDLVDAQHKALFAAVNRLAEALGKPNPGEAVKESLDFLAQYANKHFQAEEQFMRDSGFPGLKAHAEEHVRLLNRVGVLQARLAEGSAVTLDVAGFFSAWLKNHICGTDMAYVQFIHANKRAGSLGTP